jgi:hypothetical protein
MPVRLEAEMEILRQKEKENKRKRIIGLCLNLPPGGRDFPLEFYLPLGQTGE